MILCVNKMVTTPLRWKGNDNFEGGNNDVQSEDVIVKHMMHYRYWPYSFVMLSASIASTPQVLKLKKKHCKN